MKLSVLFTIAAALVASGNADKLENPHAQGKRPDVNTAASIARTLINRESLANVNTVYQDGDEEGLPVSFVEYYADCGDGNPVILAVDMGTSFKNVAKGSKATLSIRTGDHPLREHVNPRYPGSRVDSTAGSPRISLRGKFVEVSEEETPELQQCFLDRHEDAAWWLPGNPIHSSHFVKFEVDDIYFLGGFGDTGYIGKIPLELYQKADVLKFEDKAMKFHKEGGFKPKHHKGELKPEFEPEHKGEYQAEQKGEFRPKQEGDFKPKHHKGEFRPEHHEGPMGRPMGGPHGEDHSLVELKQTVEVLASESFNKISGYMTLLKGYLESTDDVAQDISIDLKEESSAISEIFKGKLAKRDEGLEVASIQIKELTREQLEQTITELEDLKTKVHDYATGLLNNFSAEEEEVKQEEPEQEQPEGPASEEEQDSENSDADEEPKMKKGKFSGKKHHSKEWKKADKSGVKGKDHFKFEDKEMRSKHHEFKSQDLKEFKGKDHEFKHEDKEFKSKHNEMRAKHHDKPRDDDDEVKQMNFKHHGKPEGEMRAKHQRPEGKDMKSKHHESNPKGEEVRSEKIQGEHKEMRSQHHESKESKKASKKGNFAQKVLSQENKQDEESTEDRPIARKQGGRRAHRSKSSSRSKPHHGEEPSFWERLDKFLGFGTKPEENGKFTAKQHKGKGEERPMKGKKFHRGDKIVEENLEVEVEAEVEEQN